MKKIAEVTGIRIHIAKFGLVVILMLYSLVSMAQLDPLYTQYMENLMILNPAYAGSKGLPSMMLVSRKQWVNISGAPETRTFAIHSPVNNSNTGLGLSFLSDCVGPIKQTGVYVDYSYTLNLGSRRTLALGLKGGVNFYEAGLSSLEIIDPDDPTFAKDINRSFLPNVGVGAFYYTNKFYFGLSVPKLLENTINKESVAVQNLSKEQIHIFLMSGYVFDASRIVKFKPSFMTQYVKNAPISLTLNGTFVFYDKLWLGAMYRLGDSFGGLFQYQITDQLKIGYSYDLNTSNLGAFNNGTHEIMVSYDFSIRRKKVRTPRYF